MSRLLCDLKCHVLCVTQSVTSYLRILQNANPEELTHLMQSQGLSPLDQYNDQQPQQQHYNGDTQQLQQQYNDENPGYGGGELAMPSPSQYSNYQNAQFRNNRGGGFPHHRGGHRGPVGGGPFRGELGTDYCRTRGPGGERWWEAVRGGWRQGEERWW